MKAMPQLFVVCTLGLASVTACHAESLRYLGKDGDPSRGLIELGPTRYHVSPGAEIPTWGRVKLVGDRFLVIEQIVTEAEKRRLREQGALVHDILEIHVPREDPRQPRDQAPPSVLR